MRNEKQRAAIKAKINALTVAMEAEQEQADKIENGEQWEQADKAIFDKYEPLINDLFTWQRALQYPVARGGWFKDVFCASFKVGCTHITAKQADIFYQHCDKISAKDFPHCVAGGRLFTLCDNHGRVYVEQLPDVDF